MMDYIRRHPKTTIAVIGLALILALVLTLSAATRKATSPEPDPQATTTFNSPFTQTTDDLALGYGGTSDPNQDAARQTFRIFARDSLPLPEATKTTLLSSLREALSQDAVPTYAMAYIQLDRSTINCSSKFDCRFSFYLDSPERYYEYHSYYAPDGSKASTLQQLPLPGGSK